MTGKNVGKRGDLLGTVRLYGSERNYGRAAKSV
jgi:hypothetical protein